MIRAAKTAYDAYHAEMGTMASVPAFEFLPVREQRAWHEVAGVSANYLEKLDDAYQDVRDKENKIEDLEEEAFDLRQKIEELQEELKAAKEGQTK